MGINEIKGVLEEVIPEELQPPQLKAFDSMDDKATFEGVISDDLPPPQLEAFDPSKDKSTPNSPPDEERLRETHHPVSPAMNQQATPTL